MRAALTVCQLQLARVRQGIERHYDSFGLLVDQHRMTTFRNECEDMETKEIKIGSLQLRTYR